MLKKEKKTFEIQEKKSLDQIRISTRELLKQEMEKNENKDKSPKQFLIDFVQKLPSDCEKYLILELFSIVGVTAAQLHCKPEDVEDLKSLIGSMLQGGIMKVANNPSDSDSVPHFQLTEKGRTMFIELLFGRIEV